MNEQTSIYDVERQPLMDLEKPLIKSDAWTLTIGNPPAGTAVGPSTAFPFSPFKGCHGGAVFDMTTPLTMSYTETFNEGAGQMREFLDKWLPAATEEPTGTDMLVVDTTPRPDDEKSPLIRSPHQRWTTEHAHDVLIATFPSTRLTNVHPTFG